MPAWPHESPCTTRQGRAVLGSALVVLGCRVSPAALSPAAERRVDAGAAAFRRGVADFVLVSGGRRWGDAVEAVEMGRALEARGVPSAAVGLELASLSTLDNARFSTELLARLGIDTALVVTCEWHAPRALRDFEAFGLRVSAVVAPSPPVGSWPRWRRDVREACSEALDASLRGRALRGARAARHVT